MKPRRPVGILLAAGSGRRFDPSGLRNKLLQKLDNDVPVAVQSARNLLQVLDRVVAVVQSPQLAQQLDQLGCQSILFEPAQQGMGASLAFAIAHVLQCEPETESVLVALADMPFVATATIRQIADALESGAEIAAPEFQQQTGHPVGFAGRHFAALLALSGDHGARNLLHTFPVTRIAVEDSGVLVDIDVPADISDKKT